MTKKLILGAAAFAVGFALACVGNGGDSPVQIFGVYAADQSCTISTDIYQTRGTFDVAGIRQLGTTGAAQAQIIMTLQTKSELGQIETRSSSGQVLSDQSRNTVYLDRIMLSYRSTNPSVSFENEEIAIQAAIEPGATSNILEDFLSTKAAQKLIDNVTAGAATPMELTITVRFRGYTAGSTGATFLTNSIEFPISVIDSGLACTGGAAGVSRSGPCGAVGGQDGSPVCGGGDGGTP